MSSVSADVKLQSSEKKEAQWLGECPQPSLLSVDLPQLIRYYVYNTEVTNGKRIVLIV